MERESQRPDRVLPAVSLLSHRIQSTAEPGHRTSRKPLSCLLSSGLWNGLLGSHRCQPWLPHCLLQSRQTVAGPPLLRILGRLCVTSESDPHTHLDGTTGFAVYTLLSSPISVNTLASCMLCLCVDDAWFSTTPCLPRLWCLYLVFFIPEMYFSYSILLQNSYAPS